MSDKQERMVELESWWMRQAQAEIEATIPKAVDYGASDLVDIGRAVMGPGFTEAHYAEAGVAFYAVGKASRIMSAVREHRPVNPDSWFDLGVYAKMAQRIQETGAWPGTEGEELV